MNGGKMGRYLFIMGKSLGGEYNFIFYQLFVRIIEIIW